LKVQLPEKLLSSLTGIKGFHKEAFENVHRSGQQVTSIRINTTKFSGSEISSYASGIWEAIPWTSSGYYLSERPSFTFDPFFHAGCYYVQEASSMFLEQALKQAVDLSKPLKVLDLCAAPGGKSTHIQSLISTESLLVSNEVIRSRANVLKDNIIKWGCEKVVVTNNDPADFARLENYFDVIVVDAPCSGSGLFRRDPEAIYEWSENNVQLCSQRQQRILSDVLPALKEGGVLVYSTCSYSKEEDEDIASWLVRACSLHHVPCSIPDEWNIVESEGGYRFWPHKVKGEGFFISVFKKAGGDDKKSVKTKMKLNEVNKSEFEFLKGWFKTGGLRFVKKENKVYAWPEKQFNDFNFLLQKLNVVYSGVLTGELVRDKLVPDHALAMSSICSVNMKKEELDYETAIKYLQRKDIELSGNQKGWALACFQNRPLGWMNILPGRINNYYPKELRIMKESPGR
jgi:16S rRNA C967 or C1407 C5-methylase (RsmB/RsmF family)/NOL1/NOP2/fmu family ribosome biogenesis protein